MKPYTYALLAAAAACGLASAAETAYTTPVGYNTQSLLQGYNVVGLTLQNSPVAVGDFETVSGTALSDSDVTYAPVAGRTYVLEITTSATPSLVGVIQEIPAASISGSVITTPQDLGALGLAADDTYKLRLAPTLEELFTTTSLSSGGVLQAALNSSSADIVWVPTGTGTYVKYYLHSSGAFRNVATNTASPNIPVIYPDGMYVQKKGATAAALTVTGEVKTVGTNSVVVQGYNLLSVVAPAGLNLWNAGLEDDLQAALNSSSADIVWVQQPNLSYAKYFRHSSGNWRDVAAPTVNLTQVQAEAVVLPSAITIQRKSATSVNIDLNVPANYSSL